MRIQEIADTIGLSKKAINLYEKKGLLQVIRDENGYRCYTQEHVRILMRIKILRRMDVSLADIEQLLAVLHQLRDQGNSIVVIEHNLDVIKTADWIVDLGPEGGSGGGEILIAGTPEEVAACERSHTARFLKPILKRGY